jgi:hypothetical protein
MNLDYEPISSPSHIEEALGIVELIALFSGECFEGDLEWDEDQLLDNYLESIEDPLIRADFEIERAAGIQAAKDQVIGDLRELIVGRHGKLGFHSPFEWDFGRELLLKRKSRITPVGYAYIWLSIFWLLRSENNYLVATPDDKGFLRSFDKVFEATCAFALAGRRESAVWYLGSSRNAQELLRRLLEVTQFCGSGLTKGYNQLTKTQKRANDGGVDVLAVTTIAGSVTLDSEIYLLGATIQKKGRRPKLIGVNQVTRLRGYFMHQPNPPMIGALAVPFAHSYLDAEECAEQNCLYLSKDNFLAYMGQHGRDAFTGHLGPASRRIMTETRTWRKAVTLRN